ncbi:Rho guanine nucleotide exchange factor [Marasmius tenuissimus]|uniref:Rho guanine nucleotide exchange factor n=1 Tax=Marasmius tenuissimus TaxID=585030 RepID=A0ABR2ZQT4_9AGAR
MMDRLEDAQQMVQDILTDEHKYRKILEARGDDAQSCLDLLQVLTERSNIQTTQFQSPTIKMMLRLSQQSGLCPKCFVVKNVKKLGKFPVASGGFGDVWKGENGKQMVCLKVVKIYQDSDVEKLIKEFIGEAIVWKQLKHPNLLPFMGMYYLDDARELLALVSPWMEKGNLTQYLKEVRGKDDVDYLSLAYYIAAGLEYLHGKEIAHGDLKGPNILIDAYGSPRIGDFGMSRVAASHTLKLLPSIDRGSLGTTRWLAPELMFADLPRPSTRGDIYAYGCVCYESEPAKIFSGQRPFHKLHERAVMIAVMKKERPGCEEDITEFTKDLSKPVWEILEACWQYNEGHRPPVAHVLSLFGGLNDPKPAVTQSPFELHAGSSASDHIQTQLEVEYPPIDTSVLGRLLSDRSSTPYVNDPRSTKVIRVSLPSQHSSLTYPQIQSDHEAADGNIAQASPLSPSPLTSHDPCLEEPTEERSSVAESSETPVHNSVAQDLEYGMPVDKPVNIDNELDSTTTENDPIAGGQALQAIQEEAVAPQQIYDVLQDRQKCQEVLEASGEEAQRWLDLLSAVRN